MPVRSHRRESSPAPQALTFGRACLVLVVVAAALFAPARGTGVTATTPADRAHHTVGTRPADPGHHVATIRVVRSGSGAHHRTAPPFGNAPAAVALAGLAVALVAISRRTPLAARRPRPAFLRRGPPALRTAS